MRRKKRKIGKDCENIVFDNVDSFRRVIILTIFPDLSEDAVTEKVKRYSSNRVSYFDDLVNLLTSLRYDVVEGVFNKYFAKREYTSKIHLVQAIVGMFYEEESLFSKREQERVVIGELDSDSHFQQEVSFIEMRGIIVPVDVSNIILSYLDRNSSILFDVGSVCKCFYINILSTWSSVMIEKKHIFQVSLLVLSNVKKVTFVEIKSNSRCNFILSEVLYIISKLNPTKLREIEICTSQNRVQQLLNMFNHASQVSDHEKSVFGNVITLSFISREELGEIGYGSVYDRSLSESIDLSSSFTHLKVLNQPYNSMLFAKCQTIESFIERIEGGLKKTEDSPLFLLAHIPIGSSEILFPNLKSLFFEQKSVGFGSQSFLDNLNKSLESILSHYDSLESLGARLTSDYLKIFLSSSLNHFFTCESKLRRLYLEEIGGDKHFSFRSGRASSRNVLSNLTYLSIDDLSLFFPEKLIFMNNMPSFDVLFTKHFPNVKRFHGAFNLLEQDSIKTTSNFSNYLFENIIMTKDVFEVSFLAKKLSGRFKHLFQIFYSSNRKELKIYHLTRTSNPVRKSRRIRRRSGLKPKIETKDEEIGLIKVLIDSLKLQNGEKIRNRVQRVVIGHSKKKNKKNGEEEEENEDDEIEKNMGIFKWIETYGKRVTIIPQLQKFFQFTDGRIEYGVYAGGDLESIVTHSLYLLP